MGDRVAKEDMWFLQPVWTGPACTPLSPLFSISCGRPCCPPSSPFPLTLQLRCLLNPKPYELQAFAPNHEPHVRGSSSPSFVSPSDNNQQPIKIIKGFFEGDKFRPYLPVINPNVTDSKGK